MTKRRLIRWSLILAMLAAFAVWLEPTRVVWGWLRGEAFYQGRPLNGVARNSPGREALRMYVEDTFLTSRTAPRAQAHHAKLLATAAVSTQNSQQ